MAAETNRKKIVETALEMFNTRGLRGVTMDDIAQAMHMSKRTLYETFANKEELLAECLMSVHDCINQRHRAAHQRVDEPLLVAMYMLRTNALFIHRYRHLVEDAERYYPDIHDRFFRIHTDTLRGLLERGMAYMREHGYLRPDAKVDTSVNFLCRLMQQHRLSDVADSQSYAIDLNEICFTYIRGLVTVETIQRYESQEDRFRQVMDELNTNINNDIEQTEK